jgi:uncharacterized DUF497 family protein
LHASKQQNQLRPAVEIVYTKCVSGDIVAFSWDEQKREENWNLRKVDFAEAIGIFDDAAVIEAIDSRTDYGEERIQALGKTGDVFYLIVYTWRGETRHIITAWKVGEHGKRRYEAIFARRHRRDEGEA